MLPEHSKQKLLRLVETNRKLHEYKRNVVKVTGPGGSPVYAVNHSSKTQLRDRHFHEWGLHLLNSTQVHIEGFEEFDTTLPTCPVQDIEKCEVHIGEKVLPLAQATNRMTLSSVGGLSECLVYDIDFSPGSDIKLALEVEWGPIEPLVPGEGIFPQNYRNEDIDFVRFQDVEFTIPPPDSSEESDSDSMEEEEDF